MPVCCQVEAVARGGHPEPNECRRCLVNLSAKAALLQMDEPPQGEGVGLPVTVRHTFLTVSCVPEAPLQPRASSMPPSFGCDCDREDSRLSALTFKVEPVIASLPRAPNSGAAHAKPLAAVWPEGDSESTATPDGDSASEGTSTGYSARRSISIDELTTHYTATPASSATLEQPFSSLQHMPGDLQYMQGDLQYMPGDMHGGLASIGSMGHAEGNCKPCVFAHHATKTCMNGYACAFCHFDHPPKRRKQPTRQRRR